MIERATACLKSGARDSLRCAQKNPRSKRALNHTFWSHGAGDLDLPPWLPLNVDLSPENPEGNASSADLSVKHNKPSGATKCHHDGIFLDFLYPPQTLAWLGRFNGLCRERWKARHARRLSEGFMQVSRGFKSKSHQVSCKSGHTEEQTHKGTPNHFDSATGHQNAPANYDDNGVVSHVDDPHDSDLETILDDAHGQNQSSVVGADFSLKPQLPPVIDGGEEGILHAESQSVQYNSVDTRQHLVRILARRLRSRKVTQEAWRLFNELHEGDKEDVRLKTELLTWMSKAKSSLADAVCISLYWSIPLQARSLAIYQAVLDAFLRRKDHEFAISLQREALGNIDNGHVISQTLFAHLVVRESWDMALAVMECHMEAFAGSMAGSSEELFWINTLNIPHLVRRSANLCRWVLSRRHDGADVARYSVLSTKLANEAVSHYLQHIYPSLPNESKMSDIEMLLRHLNSSGKLTPKFLSNALLRMLDLPRIELRKAQVHAVISLFYWIYRQSTDFRPSERMFLLLLEQTATQAARSRVIFRSNTRITVDVITEDYKKVHGKLSLRFLRRVLAHYAYVGDVVKAQELCDYLTANWDTWEDQRHAYPTLIYVHARRADLRAARNAFDWASQMATENSQQLDVMCWNNLLYAHARVDDVAGMLSTFQELLDQKETKPTAISFQPILQMLAGRADMSGLEKCLHAFDRMVGEPRPLAFTATVMTALSNMGEMVEAESELRRVLSRIRDGFDHGSLTPHFNILITGYALRRNTHAMMQTYRWMREEGVRLNSMTYAALLQGLVMTHKIRMAYRLLLSIMSSQAIDVTAFHYAVVMGGFNSRRQYHQALRVHKLMIHANIKESISSKRAFLMASMMLENENTPSENETGKPVSLQEVQEAIQEAVKTFNAEAAAPKEPLLGLSQGDMRDGLALYIAPLVLVYGRRQCFEALEGLLHQYKTQHVDETARTPPIKLLTAFMASHLSMEEFTEVEACWSLVMKQAEMEISLPALSNALPRGVSMVGSASDSSLGIVHDDSADSADAGFDTRGRVETLPREETKVIVERKSIKRPKISATQRHILSDPLGIYLAALAGQSRYVDAIKIVARLLSQGWVLRNQTWNAFIRMLCKSSPPLALSAFTFTERYLIPNFPGWARSRQKYQTRRGTEHFRVRDLRPDQSFPQYRTLVHLGSALLQLRHQDATSGHARALDAPKELTGFIGDVRKIRERAPRTVFAIQSMPKVHDNLQNQLLRSDV